MGEGVFADDGLVALDEKPRQGADQLAAGHDVTGVDPGVEAEEVFPGAERHDDFLHGGVAGPFADAVDGAFHLPGAGLDGGQRIGHRQAQIVVAVNAEDRPLDSRDVFFQVPDQTGEFAGNRVAHRVGNVDGFRPRIDHGPDHLHQEVGLRARGVHGGKFDVVAILARAGHPFHRHVDDLLLGLLDHVLAVRFGSGKKDMDPGRFRLFQSAGVGLDVFFQSPGQPGHRDPLHFLGDAAHGIEIAGGGGGKARFDHIHLQ